MGLTEKVIKNTYYHFLSQIIGFIFPFLLVPFIIKHIGEAEFGIYALSYGFIGAFTLLDLGISTSYIKFISEYYNRQEFDNLNRTINTGMLFYFIFTILFCILGFLFSSFILSVIKIPHGLYDKGLFAIRICLLIFVVATNSYMFISVLTSLQKLYVNSIIGIIVGILNFVGIIFTLSFGYGLYGLLIVQFFTACLSTLLGFMLAKRSMPQMSFGLKYIKWDFFKKMSGFGLQMQVSKTSSFLSEKYDEFLLGVFSSLNSVTYFNLAGRIVRLGRFLPIQLFQQVAPVAAELNAKEEKDKLNQLFSDTSKYLTLVALPLFIYIFLFADLILVTWIGTDYKATVFLLRILVVGQIVNLTISAPGNAIIPNIGIPKYLMREGLIMLVINLFLSYILIRYYDIVGAAIGNSVSMVIGSVYMYFASTRFFKQKKIKFLIFTYVPPVIISAVIGFLIYLLYLLFINNILTINNRINGIFCLVITFFVYLVGIFYFLYKTKYLTDVNRKHFLMLIKHILPFKMKSIDDYLNKI